MSAIETERERGEKRSPLSFCFPLFGSPSPFLRVGKGKTRAKPEQDPNKSIIRLKHFTPNPPKTSKSAESAVEFGSRFHMPINLFATAGSILVTCTGNDYPTNMKMAMQTFSL